MKLLSSSDAVILSLLGLHRGNAAFSDGTVGSAQKISNTYGDLSDFYDIDNNDLFASVVDYIGDLDGDGIGDIVCAATRDDDGGYDAGAIYITLVPSPC